MSAIWKVCYMVHSAMLLE